ncbi:MAG: serine/threonine-protein phosphatase [Acidobacteriaceae bacterium]|nr:serine/threonine-protein phosphatase [Acidobacteriaceae bacterium]
MPVRSDIELANLTDVGCVRPENEDYYCYFEPESDEEFERKGRLLAVADGMGGHAGGQVASGLAVDALREVFLDGGTSDPRPLLVEAFGRAQQSILAASDARPELNGMGTTCTAAIVRGHQLDYGHIGDSRLYLVRAGQAHQLTEDHSLVNQLVKSGALAAEEAETHQERNVLTAALGMRSPQASADFSHSPVALEPHDLVILTSDGLHGLVSAEEIAAATYGQTPYEACRALVDLAKARGGPDNITIQILKILPDAHPATQIE